MRPRRGDIRGRGGPQPSALRQALTRFFVWSMVALVLLGAGAAFISDHIARDEAVRDARSRGVAIAQGVAGPVLDGHARAGEPAALTRLGEALRNRMRDGSVTHIKLWDRDGTVIWSDEPAVAGRRFALPRAVAPLFGTDDVVATLSGMDRPEDAGEEHEGPILEVFAGARDADGVPFVFEAHMSPQRLEEDRTAILTELLPLALGVLLVFQLTTLPLAVSLARRVQRGQNERAQLLRRALMSSELERRRIAQDLHDGVIQDLAGLSYALPSVVSKLPDDPGLESTRRTARRMTSILQHNIAALRSLLGDIYPPNLEGEGLRAAIDDLATSAADSEVAVAVNITPGLAVPPDTARLVYRVVREGLRNVVRHAAAQQAHVLVHRVGERVVVRVVDDGRGLSAAGDEERGHLGVKLLADTVADVGGRLELRSGESGGAVLEASFPAALPA